MPKTRFVFHLIHIALYLLRIIPWSCKFIIRGLNRISLSLMYTAAYIINKALPISRALLIILFRGLTYLFYAVFFNVHKVYRCKTFLKIYSDGNGNYKNIK